MSWRRREEDSVLFQNEAGHKRHAEQRRAALNEYGCATYELQKRGGHDIILCVCCGLGSAHPEDIAQKFCGFCDFFHDEWRVDDLS